MDGGTVSAHANMFDPPWEVFSHSGARQNCETALSLSRPRDDELGAKVHSGNGEAFYSLVEPHLQSARYLVRSLIENRADIEDVVQDAILNAFTKIHQLRCRHLFRAWFMRIALNSARMKLRREKTRGRVESLDAVSDDRLAPVPDQLIDRRELPSRAAENKELRKKLQQALDCLPRHYRDVVVLRDIQGLSMREIAATLGLNLSLTKTRLHRARLRLRAELSPFWRKLVLESSREYSGICESPAPRDHSD